MAVLHYQRFENAVALGSGVLVALNQPPFFVPIGLIGLALMAHRMMNAITLRQALRLGWLFGMGYFALTLHWIVEPFLVDAARHGWMAPFALIFISAGLALFWALAAGLSFGLCRGPARLIAFAVAFTLVEWLRGTILTGFPWLPIGFILSHGPGGALLASFGPYGTTLLALSLASALVALLSDELPFGARLLPLATTLGIAAAGWFIGFTPVLPDQTQPVIRIVQPNAPQHLKWDPAHSHSFFERAIRLTEADTATQPDLVIWPETSILSWLDHAQEDIAQIAEASTAPVLAGIRRFEGRRFYNSAIVIEDHAITALYDKHHLVPFGEYIPFGNVLNRFGIHGLAAEEGGGYSPGSGPRPIEIPAIGTLNILICYEAVFPAYANWGSTSRPRALVNITNDAWFGNWAGPSQHLAHARARALEQGLPMLRAANTGISTIIAPDGQALTQIPLNTAGFTDHALPAATEPTLYAITGDLPVLMIVFLVLATLPVTKRMALH